LSTNQRRGGGYSQNVIEPLVHPGSGKIYGREPKSCLGRVFNVKVGHFASKQHKCIAHMQPLLELKTWPRFCPIN
jgi:hypothetical protein